MSDHNQELSAAFRRLEEDLDDLRRMAGLGMLAVEANEPDLIRFTVAEMATKSGLVWEQYQAAFLGNRSSTS
jgi:hypothetical protein